MPRRGKIAHRGEFSRAQAKIILPPPLTNFSSTPLIGTISDVLITFVEDALGNRASSIIGSVTFL